MSIIEFVDFKGASGRPYNFKAYELHTRFKALGAVYIFANRMARTYGVTNYEVIYIRETGNISERFDSHHKADCINQKKADCICIYLEGDSDKRLAIEGDLIDNYNPPCND